MTAAVVDASALAALLFGEPAAEEVSRELGEQQMMAPTLIVYELGSTCWKKVRRSPGQARELEQAYALLGELDLVLHDVDTAGVLALALERDLTFYDAAYLWLARSLSLPLVTLDARLRG